MILELKRPILNSKGKYINKLEFDLYDLTIRDFNNIEKLYFNLVQDKADFLIPESQLIYKLCAMFISCAKINKELSFIGFLGVKGRDKRRISAIVDSYFIPNDIFNKKKDSN